MNTRTSAFALLLTIALAGCDRDSPATADNGIRQTKFPGQVSAGGGTSGAIMAQTAGGNKAAAPSGTPGIPQGVGGNAGQEGMRGQAPGGTGAAGTPGIPEGSGGTTSGAEMGGTTGGAAATQTGPGTGSTPPAGTKQDNAK